MKNLVFIILAITAASLSSCGPGTVTETVIITDNSGRQQYIEAVAAYVNAANSYEVARAELDSAKKQYQEKRRQLQPQIDNLTQKLTEAYNDLAAAQNKLKAYEDEDYSAVKLYGLLQERMGALKGWLKGVADGTDNLTAANMTPEVKIQFREDFKEIYAELPDWAR
jgi:chromosome segregation ATPase